MVEKTLNVPPFPALGWDEYFWAGEVVLGSWAGFQTRRGPYGSVSSDAKSDGLVRLTVTSEDDSPNPPLPEQIQAFQFLLDNEEAVAESVLKAIFAEYPRLRDLYDMCVDEEGEEEFAEVMPAIERAEQLRGLIGLSNVHVIRVASGGLAYVGFEFGCTWDGEHGLGVMTHRGRVIEVGNADTSFLWWVADRDARSL